MVPAWNGYCFPRWSGRLIRRVTAGPVGKESRPTGITQAAQVSRRCGRGKLDPDLLDIFITKRVYEVTAEK